MHIHSQEAKDTDACLVLQKMECSEQYQLAKQLHLYNKIQADISSIPQQILLLLMMYRIHSDSVVC